MDGVRIRTVEFRTALRGYDRGEVDDRLEEIAKAVDIGEWPIALIGKLSFRGRWTMDGYRRSDVDEFVELLRTSGPGIAHTESWFPPPHSVAPDTGASAAMSNPTATSPSHVPVAPSTTGIGGSLSSSPVEIHEFDELREAVETSRVDPSTTVWSRLGRVFFGPPALLLYSAVLLGLVGWSIATFVSDQIHNAEFARTGVVIHPRVVSRYHDDEGQDGVFDYLYVVIPACNCRVELPTTNLAGHPVGSRVPVRYDPKNPRDARIMVDGNNGWLADFIPASFDVLVLAAFVYVIGGDLRIRWKYRRRAHRQADERPAR